MSQGFDWPPATESSDDLPFGSAANAPILHYQSCDPMRSYWPPQRLRVLSSNRGRGEDHPVYQHPRNSRCVHAVGL